MQNPKLGNYLRPREAANRLSVDVSTIYRKFRHLMVEVTPGVTGVPESALIEHLRNRPSIASKPKSAQRPSLPVKPKKAGGGK